MNDIRVEIIKELQEEMECLSSLIKRFGKNATLEDVLKIIEEIKINQ